MRRAGAIARAALNLAPVAAVAAMLVLLAASARSQGRLISDPGGGGVSGGGATQGVAITTNQTRQTVTYTFEGSPPFTSNGSNNAGWSKTSSSSLSEITGEAPIIMTGDTPTLNIEMQFAGAYQRVQERMGGATAATALNGQHRSDEYRVAFDFKSNGAEAMTSDTGFLQITVGDTTFMKFSKKPKGFGLVFVGSDCLGAAATFMGGIPADWPRDTWIGFVGNGTDTTYVPLKAENLTTHDFWYIYAAPGGGPVQFYCNGVLLKTISDVTRDTGEDVFGFSVQAMGGDDGQPEVALGPLTIERNW